MKKKPRRVKMLAPRMIEAVKAHAQGEIEKHKMNVEIYLTNPAGIGEHPDIVEAVESELGKIAEYHDILEVLERYFDV